MRLPRFTLRRLMILVALAALALGIERGYRYRQRLLAIEKHHAVNLVNYRKESTDNGLRAKQSRERAAKFRAGFFLSWPKALVLDQAATVFENNAEAYREIADFHQRMREKYRKAAWFPFWPVEPDPPAPMRELVVYTEWSPL
jgi:hypothetical protein